MSELEINSVRDSAFEALLAASTPDPEISIPLRTGPLLVFKTEPSAERISAAIRKRGETVETFKAGKGAPPEWAPYRSRSRNFLMQALFLCDCMVGFYRSFEIVETKDAEDEIVKIEHKPVGERLAPWTAEQWFRFEATSGYQFNWVYEGLLKLALSKSEETFIAAVDSEKKESTIVQPLEQS